MPSLSNRIKAAYYEARKPVTLSVQEGSFVLVLPLGAAVSVYVQRA